MYLIRNKKRFFILLGIIMAVLALIAISIAVTYNSYKKDLPSLSQLHNIEPSLSTKLYGIDGTLIKEFYTERRTLIPLKELPPCLVDALLATEDRRFYHHWGIDLFGIVRALASNITQGKITQGAS